jgi:hypothetical protein
LQTTVPSKSSYPSTTVTTPSSKRAGNENFNSLLVVFDFRKTRGIATIGGIGVDTDFNNGGILWPKIWNRF